MDMALFWLPILGGILLGGIALGEWYSGSKVCAVWVGFAGINCFLLVLAIQIQAAVRQPKSSASARPDISNVVDRLGQLLADNKRPWVSLDVEPVGALAYDNKGWDAGTRWYVPIRYTVKNTSATPANGVAFFASIQPSNLSVWPSGSDGKPIGQPTLATDIAKELEAACDFPTKMAQQKMGWGHPLFPGEQRQQNFMLNGNPAIFEAAKKNPGYSGQFLVIACAVYGEETDVMVYRTAKAFLLFKPTGNIDLSGETVALGEFGFVPHPQNSGYAK